MFRGWAFMYRNPRNLQRGPTWVHAALALDFSYKTDRPTYHPAMLELAEDGWRVRVVPWFGSADLRGLTRANALVYLDPNEEQHRAGESKRVLKIEE